MYPLIIDYSQMVKCLKDACKHHKILNYWDDSHNLLDCVQPKQLQSVVGRLEKIIKNITDDPLMIAKSVCEFNYLFKRRTEKSSDEIVKSL